MPNVQALETVRGLNEIKGYVRSTLDKLSEIGANLVRLYVGKIRCSVS